MERFLLPTEKQLQNAWTTLDDRNLQIHKVTASTSHHLVSPPSRVGPAAPDAAWEAFYPKGSINPQNPNPGGFGFYLSGPPGFQAGLKTANGVLFGYSAMFDTGWTHLPHSHPREYDYPGVGGDGDSAYGCAGGRKEDRCRCFSLRLMWRFVTVDYIPKNGLGPLTLCTGGGDPARFVLASQNSRKTPRNS